MGIRSRNLAACQRQTQVSGGPELGRAAPKPLDGKSGYRIRCHWALSPQGIRTQEKAQKVDFAAPEENPGPKRKNLRDRRVGRARGFLRSVVLIQMAGEPLRGHLRDLFERARFFEKVRCARNDAERLFAPQRGVSF